MTTWSGRRTKTSPATSAIIGRPAITAASGAWLAWQTPTASASVAWSGSGSSGRPSTAQTMRATCSLAARPVPQTACLTCWGV